MKDHSITSHFLTKKSREELFKKHSFSKSSLLYTSTLLKDAAQRYNDEEVASNVDYQIKKIKAENCVATICGHFSAGKSTLINQIIGKSLLPSHPIPTSANIVHFQGGNTSSFSYRETNSGKIVELKTSTWQEEWFTSADQMEEIYISLPDSTFPENLEIVDTPGIDSIDNAHRLAAEKHLKQADKVYYVVDYQQVEAEENFLFLQQLNDMYIAPVLLVNQVDKHDESEMPFTRFQEKIIASIHKQYIQVSGVYFISALQPFFHQEDWLLFTKELFQLPQNKHTALQTFALGLYRELERLTEKFAASIRPPKEIVSKMKSFPSLESLEKEKMSLQDNIETLPKWKLMIEKETLQALNLVFRNAKLTPYHTRNFIRDYLESRQASFRIKGIFSRKKTSQERHRREEKLLKSLNENIRNYIDIHLRDTLQAILTKYHIHDRELLKQIFVIHHPVDRKLLRTAERKGALFSQEYTITYSRLLVSEIRKQYKSSVVEMFPEIQRAMRKEQKNENERLLNTLSELEKTQEEWKRWREDYRNVYRLYYHVLGEIQDSKQPLPISVEKPVPSMIPKMKEFQAQNKMNLEPFYKGSQQEGIWSFASLKQHAATKLERAHDTLKKVSGIRGIEKSLAQRAQRLRQKNYRITLFGAFSAGKSTLTNAFIGEKLLPAAANPTTASVQYIKAPDLEHPHNTVVIHYKSEKDILTDMNDVIRPASISLQTIEEWATLLKEQEIKDKEDEKEKRTNQEEEREGEINPFSVLQKEEIELLHQYYHAYQEYEFFLNKSKKLNNQDYVENVSDEKIAMLIKEVTFYYDCALTREGFILTDTPGAGSIYRRHSEIAFNEIKKADAILFVSYYNHSFSKADREFLIQLGRMKDYFSYDKMFFLVNAADLANSKKEVADVLTYVFDQLVRFGIQTPRVYPISSKIALENSSKEDLQRSGVDGFLQEFQRFADESLEKMIIQEGMEEIRQAVCLLEDRVKVLKMEEKAQEQKRENHIYDVKNFMESIQNFNLQTEIDFIKQEIEELLFYVKQRVFYRYYDTFKEIFRIIRFDQKEFPSQLHRFTNELIQDLFHDIFQEIRATVIRMEHFIQKLWYNMQESFLKTLPTEIRQAFVFQQITEFPAITVKEEIPVNSGHFSFIKDFKSYKEFFVDEKRNVLKETLEEVLRPFGEEMIDNYNSKLLYLYESFFRDQWALCQGEFTKISNELIHEFKKTPSQNSITPITSAIIHLKDITEQS